MIVRQPSSQFTADSSAASSYCSSAKPPSAFTEDWDADDEDTMSHEEYPPPSSKPLSVAIPNPGPYCPRRPYLKEILANTSPAPWTLAAFMAYLSNNHCLETLEFTMDAGRYKKHYAKMMSKVSASDGLPPAGDRQYVRDLWNRLVDAYIRPNGSREVNLPSNVRDSILNLTDSNLPPAPERLEPAVAKIYELMEDSVLVPFLNSSYLHSAQPLAPSAPSAASDDEASAYSRSHGGGSASSRRPRSIRNSDAPQFAGDHVAHAYSAPSHTLRKSGPTVTSPTSRHPRHSTKLTTSTSSPATLHSRSSMVEAGVTESDGSLYPAGIERIPAMMDDSGSTNSPTGDSPSTPPASPPMSDASSPKRDSGMWKKLGRFSGMKAGKKRSHGGLRPQEE